eukprot:2162297-Rhodomonas_salina.2
MTSGSRQRATTTRSTSSATSGPSSTSAPADTPSRAGSSRRAPRLRGRFGEAVREGIPTDGGVLAPNRFPDLRRFLPEWKGLALSEIGARVAAMLLIRCALPRALAGMRCALVMMVWRG